MYASIRCDRVYTLSLCSHSPSIRFRCSNNAVTSFVHLQSLTIEKYQNVSTYWWIRCRFECATCLNNSHVHVAHNIDTRYIDGYAIEIHESTFHWNWITLSSRLITRSSRDTCFRSVKLSEYNNMGCYCCCSRFSSMLFSIFFFFLDGSYTHRRCALFSFDSFIVFHLSIASEVLAFGW